MEHSVLLVDPISKQVLATVGVDINAHEVAVSPDGRFGYVPIYGNTWVGMPGSNGSTIHVVDLRQGRTVAVIDLGKEVRPHSAHFGPDGLLYVSAELANAIYIVDTKTRSLVGEIPTGASHTHMFVISPDGQRIYTANNEAGSVSVLDLRARTSAAWARTEFAGWGHAGANASALRTPFQGSTGSGGFHRRSPVGGAA
jgi:DNA-binding beta-propeller fold protein YncE